MSNFFRDSSLFSTRNKGSLFPNVNSNSKIKFDNNEFKLNDKKKGKIIASNVEISSLFRNKNSSNEKNMKNNEMENNCETQNQNKDNDNDLSETDIKENKLNPKIEDENDEDIEITGIRDIAITNYSDTTFETSNTLHSEAEAEDLKIKSQKTKEPERNPDNLDNVSIEYLLNTIQHLSEKNKCLLKENKDLKQEREDLSIDLDSKTESINILKHKIAKFKITITNSNILLKELKNNSIDLNSKRNILTEEIKKTKDVLSKEHEFVYSLKNIVSTLKSQNSINESKINQKRQHIDDLKQKVNDLAGRLSEEKIKNSNLTKEIFDLSKKNESALFSLATENKRQIELVIKQKNEFKSKWDDFLRNLNENFEKTNKTNVDISSKLKSALDYNFNDLAVRIKNINMSTEAVKTSVLKFNDEQTGNRDTIISALSSVDKNMMNNLNNNMDTILQKFGETCSSAQLSDFTFKINENFDIISKKDEIIKKLNLEKEVFIKNQHESNRKVELLEIKLKSSQDETQILNNKVYEMKTVNTELINKYTPLIAELQNEKKKLMEGLESSNKLYESKLIGYQKEVEEMRKKAKQNEDKNIMLFNEEKKKMDILNKNSKEKEKYCLLLETEKGVMQKELNCSKKLLDDLRIELNSLKSAYDSEVMKSKEMETKLDNANTKLDKSMNEQRSLEGDFINKAKQVTQLEISLNLKDENIRSLQNEIENIKNIANKLEESRSNEVSKGNDVKEFQNINPRKLFAQSRTSTMNKKVKQERNIKMEPNRAKEIVVKIEKQKKNTKQTRSVDAKYSEKEDLLITKNFNKVHEKKLKVGSITTKSKRKLISSSQISLKSSSQNNKKDRVITKQLLQDLDIFNEFEAIDRLGTISKPVS